LLDYDRPVVVEGHEPSLGTKTYATISGVLAYDDPVTGEVYHIVINQAIHIPHLDHRLLCPMQCRVNDVLSTRRLNFWRTTPLTIHMLTIRDPQNPAQMVILPLALQSVTSLINVRAPTLDEWNSDSFTRLSLTSESLTWDPTTTLYSDQEAAMTNYSGNVVRCAAVRGHAGILAINSLSSLSSDLVDVTDDENFHQVLTSKVMISSVKTSLNGHIQSRNVAPIDAQTLAAHWMISPDHAKCTVVMTTQRGVRTCLNLTLSRRFPTNNRMLRYKRLPHTVFTDTMFASTVSRQSNKMAQIYSTSFGWAHAHLMKRKGEAHETLSLLFHCDGVPLAMVTDGLKEQTSGDF